MKWYSYLFPILPIIFLFIEFIYPKSPAPPSPASIEKTNYINQLLSLTNSGEYLIDNIKYYNYRQEIEFNLLHHNTDTRVILPVNQNVYFQVSLLQKIIKKANIERKDVRFIDLSSFHPYATLQNN